MRFRKGCKESSVHATFLLFSLVMFALLLKCIRFNRSRINHLFILRSFYYPESEMFTDFPRDTVVILFNMEEDVRVDRLQPMCLSGAYVPKATTAKIDTLFVGEVKCRLTVYRMVCFPAEPPSAENFALRLNDAAPVQLQISDADSAKKDIVVCPGRMFAFEQWHLFITAMELHRIHQVDLVVIYVQSVDSQVYKLLKLYEKDGLVTIRRSLLMPSWLATLDFNPNDETQWNTQIVNFQECLYEFRESSQFIVFPDWDDLLVTTNFQPLPSVLAKVQEKMPKICSFVVARYIGAIETLDTMTDKQHDLPHVWRHGLAFTRNESLVQHVGKVLARPKHVDAIRFHDAIVPKGCDQAEAPIHLLYMIHARNYFHLSLETTLHNVPQLITNFNKHIGRDPAFDKLLPKLPRRDSALDQFFNCLGFKATGDMWGRIFKIVQESTGSKCYSYSRCGIHEVKLAGECVNVQNRWQTNLSGHFSISILHSSSFVKGKSQCIV